MATTTALRRAYCECHPVSLYTVNGGSIYAKFDTSTLKKGRHTKLRVFVTKPEHKPGHAPPIPRLDMYPLPHAEIVLDHSIDTCELHAAETRFCR